MSGRPEGQGPPRLVVALLKSLLAPGIVREDVLGDLTETYHRLARRSRWRAALWCWGQVISLALHRAKARLTDGPETLTEGNPARDRRGGAFMNGFWGDIRYALRGFLRRPGFAIAAILTIGLGVGANAAIFSVINGVLLRPLPWPDADGLVAVWQEKRWSAQMLVDVRERTTSFESIALLTGDGYTLLGDGDAERVTGARVSDTYFEILRVRPVLGRLFVEEDRFGESGGVAIISHGLWQRRYSSDPDVVGRAVQIAGAGRESRTIIGVLPEDYAGFFGSAEVWTPIDMSPESVEDGSYGYSVIGRLAEGRTAEVASAEMRSLVSDFSELHPTQFREIRYSPIDVVPLRESMIGDSRTTLLLLLAGVGVVLLIACTNVANLLLARAVHRQREFEVRIALGARPGRIVRQTLVEASMLGLAGGIAGVLIALASTPLLAAPVAAMMPRDATSVLHVNVLLFATGVSLAAGLLFGSVSARLSFRTSGRLVHDGARGSTGGRMRHRVNNALVVAEVALAVLVVVAGSLLVKSFRTLISQDPGFATERVLAVQVAPPDGRYSEETALEQYFTTLLERIEALPGVEAASAIAYLPMSGSWAGTSVNIEGQERPAGAQAEVISFNAVTPEYFATMGLPIIRGRNLADTDRDGSTSVGVVNEAFANQHWPDESAIGHTVLNSGGDPLFDIVGVVADIRQRGLDEEPAPEFYLTPGQSFWNLRFIMVRGNADDLRASVMNAVRELDRDVPILGARTMEEVIDDGLGSVRSRVILFGSFAVLALVLGMIGIYGLVSYTVSQRLREIGVRLALGATSGNVLGQTLVRAVTLVGTGVAIGIALALAGTRLLSNMLFQVQPADPGVFVLTVLLMAGAGAAASLVPAVRAARASPLTALRVE